MTSHKINFYLRRLSQRADHQRLFDHVAALTAMQRVFSEIAPPRLAGHCALGGLSGGKLIIFARNGAIAAKLRQMTPSLLSKFQAKGYEVTAIRIAVQAHSTVYGDDARDGKRSMSEAGRESLRQLAMALPSSPLKTSVESLLQKAGKVRQPAESGMKDFK
jgi:hypothetical protein